MAEEIVLKVDVELEDGAKSLRTLKQEFKDTQKELDGAVVGSEKYYNTLRKLGDLKGEIGDLNATINAFDGENKIGALGNAVGGVASGFQAAVGATALFGSESEELNKTLLKVQATMAFVEGIKGVMAMGESFAALNAVIAANPIMAVATAVVAAAGLITAAIIEIRKEEEELQKVRKKAHDERIKQLQDEHSSALNFALELKKARGASEKEAYETERLFLELRRKENRALMIAKSIHSDEYYKTEKEITERLMILDATYNTKVREESEKTKQKKIEDSKKTTEEKVKAEKDAMDAILAMEIAIAEQEGQFIEEDKKKKADAEKARQEQNQQTADLLFQQELNRINDEDKAKQDAFNNVLLRHQAERDAMAVTQGLSDVIFATRLNNVRKGSAEEQAVLKKQFDINKKFQIANAIMAGAQSIMAITSVPDFTLGVQSSLRIAAQIARTAAQIATIRRTQFAGGAGGGATPVAATTTPQAAPQATNAPVVNTPVSSSTQLNPDGTVKSTQGNAIPIVKAVVVESDITQAQKKVSDIKNVATFS